MNPFNQWVNPLRYWTWRSWLVRLVSVIGSLVPWWGQFVFPPDPYGNGGIVPLAAALLLFMGLAVALEYDDHERMNDDYYAGIKKACS
jgi:hypothetical protein